jgi:hypothetical protein
MVYRGNTRSKKDKKKKQDSLKVPLVRVPAEIQIDSTKQVIKSRVFLYDLTPEGVGCFINQAIDKGEKITLVVAHPKALYIKGEIVRCTLFRQSIKILSDDEYQFRLGIKFIYDSPEEKEAIQQFCNSL